MTAKCLTWEASAAQRPCVCVCYIHLANRDQVKAKMDFSSITVKFNEDIVLKEECESEFTPCMKFVWMYS